METLSNHNERLVLQFNGLLWGISGPDDMFPPDDSFDREAREPIPPIMPASAKLSLVGIARTINRNDFELSDYELSIA